MAGFPSFVLRSAAGLMEAGVTLTLVLVTAGFFGRWHWALDLLSHFRLQAIAALAIGGVLLVGLRRTRWGAASLAGSAALALSLVPLVASPSRSATGDGFSIIAFNVYSANTRTDEALDFLTAESADLVLLMEVTATWRDALAPLAKIYPFQISEFRSDNFGMLLLSKEPFGRTKMHALSPGIPMVEARLDLGTTTLTFFGAHPLPPAGRRGTIDRNLYLKQMAARVTAVSGKAIVAGDFNATPFSSPFRRFCRQLKLGNAGIAPTWMRENPVFALPLDHVLVTPGLVVSDRRIGPALGSDHRPVIVTLAL